jgi:hypothetical protein
MLRNVEHWKQLVRDIRMKATTTDDPYILKTYDELIEQYEREIRKLEAASATPEPKSRE